MSFDSVSWSLSLSWMSTFFLLSIFLLSYWTIDSLKKQMMKSTSSGFLFSLPKLSTAINGKMLLFFSLFMLIMMSNYLGLISYYFAFSSHILFTFALSISVWISVIFLWSSFNLKSLLVHLVPTGTPLVLLSFMVCIEFVSNMIRPVTLGVRLAANIMAGHLLLSLLAWSNTYLLGSMTQLILFFLELAVCVIQAYVFSLLGYLYFSEIS